jgi:hypothetical protein
LFRAWLSLLKERVAERELAEYERA